MQTMGALAFECFVQLRSLRVKESVVELSLVEPSRRVRLESDQIDRLRQSSD